MSAEELVVLLDEAGEAIGATAKATVHHRRTPLHLAFSCYILDDDHQLLLTRRALGKPTWPGAWTNSFCGHPAPGEDMFDAVRRRAGEELGLELTDLRLVLPAFRYDATMPNGVRENELCPVFAATTASVVRPEPAEVDAVTWIPWTTFRDDVLTGGRAVSPWSVQQVAELAEREEGNGFVAASTDALPPAARLSLRDRGA